LVLSEGITLTPRSQRVPGKHTPDRSVALLQEPPPVVSMVDEVVLLLQ
jgi:hypothetical protein